MYLYLKAVKAKIMWHTKSIEDFGEKKFCQDLAQLSAQSIPKLSIE
jgi:hypothetical protein